MRHKNILLLVLIESLLLFCCGMAINHSVLIKAQDVNQESKLTFNQPNKVVAAPNKLTNSLVRTTNAVQVKDYKSNAVLGQIELGNAGIVPITSLASALFDAQVSTIGQIQLNGVEYYLVPSDGHSLNPVIPDNSTWFWGTSANNASDYATFITNNATGLANGTIYLRAVLACAVQFKDINTGEVLKSIDLRNYNNNLFQPLNNFFKSIYVSSQAQIGIINSAGERNNYTIVPEDGTSTNPLLSTGQWFKGVSLTNSATLLDLLANYGSQLKNGTVYLQIKPTVEQDDLSAPFSEKKLDFNQNYDWELKASLNSGLGAINDIAFCFDVTGSVSSYIGNFADALGGDSSNTNPGFIEYLRSTGGVNNRYGVTNFGDYYADTPRTGWFFKNDYLVKNNKLGDGSGFYPADTPEQLQDVKNDMRNYVQNVWGGDSPEDSIYAAMRTMDEFKWRRDAKRILVVFTDISSKTRNYITVGGYPVTLAGMEGLAASKGIRLVWLGSSATYDNTNVDAGDRAAGVETITNIQTHVNYNYNSPIKYNAVSNDVNGFKNLLLDTVILLTKNKKYKYTYRVDSPVYVSDGAPSHDIKNITVTPSASTVVTGTDTPSATSDGPYFQLDNYEANHFNGQFNVHATTVANPARLNDKTKVVIHYYRDGVENVNAKQTLYLGPYPNVNSRTSLRAVPNFDFGTNLISQNYSFNMSNEISPIATQGKELALTIENDQNPSASGSVGDFLKTGVAAKPVKRGVVITDGSLDLDTGWQLETSLNNLKTNSGQAVNDQQVKVKINHPLLQGITDLGQTPSNSSFNIGCKPTIYSSEIINNGPAAIIANSFNESDPNNTAVGSWFINFENANSAQLIFPLRVLDNLGASRNLSVKGTLTWTLLSKTP